MATVPALDDASSWLYMDASSWLYAIEDRSVFHAARGLLARIRCEWKPGTWLPSDRRLARELGLTQRSVVTARRHLETRGLLTGRRVLAPDALHPDDIALDAYVRDRIHCGFYRPGSALPTGILGHDFRLTAAQVRRACRRLVADGLLHDLDAPHGAGLYIATPEKAPC